MPWLLTILLVAIPVFARPLLIAAAVLSPLRHNLVFVACWGVLVSAYLAFWLVTGIRDVVRWPGRTVERGRIRPVGYRDMRRSRGAERPSGRPVRGLVPP